MTDATIVSAGFPAVIRRSRSAHDAALEAIGFAIVSGDFAVGSLLPSKDELMRRLDVSNTTLREALQTLAAKGMVAAKAKVGTRVLGESQWNLFDADILGWRLRVGMPAEFLAKLFEIRQTLEPVAAALAAMRRGERELASMRRAVADMGAATHDPEGFVAADAAFHQCVLEASGNPFMHSLPALIGAALTASFTLSAPTEGPGVSARSYRQHKAIADAIARRDPQAASDAMMVVIRQGWANCGGAPADGIARLEVAAFK